MSPKEECENLINELVPIGEMFLKKYGEFYPYGAVMNLNGSIKHLNYYEGKEFPESKDIIENLITVCKPLAHNKEIKASAIVWNTSVVSANEKETDAIVISLEHIDDYKVKVVFPYKIGLFKKITWGELFALEGDNNIF